ncbi:hypothetical protein L3X38_043477 [Prunus dulcis]|uniref:Uncharacterized protein n=1 Tax=Prunus dulcis TaxID=3755 RepID=A0AAD4YM66_PRUDU|nr:hypothetical protein L3X38_043477 [Prunus dulcis]
MENLRLLKIWNGNFHGNIEYLSNELQFLEWHECPLNSLPSDFESDKLVELNLYSSRIEQLCEGEKDLFWFRISCIAGLDFFTLAYVHVAVVC